MGILSPFFGGIVIAYILDPMVRFFHTKLLKYSKRWRWVAILLAYLVAVLLIVLLAKCIGFVGAKTDEVRQRTKKRH